MSRTPFPLLLDILILSIVWRSDYLLLKKPLMGGFPKRGQEWRVGLWLGREENWMVYPEEMTSSTHLSKKIGSGKSASKGRGKTRGLVQMQRDSWCTALEGPVTMWWLESEKQLTMGTLICVAVLFATDDKRQVCW